MGRSLIPGDQLSQDKGQDAALVEVSNLCFVVDARSGPEALDLAIVAHRLDVDLLQRLDLSQAVDRVAFSSAQAQRLRALARCELEREEAHPDQVRAMDALEALRDHRTHTKEERALRRPVA